MVHCDLKSKNILLNTERDSAKIGDVGLSRLMADTHLSTTANGFGTLHYAAPEVLMGTTKCTEKVLLAWDKTSPGMVFMCYLMFDRLF